MEKLLTKETVEELKKIQGEVRGLTFIGEREYIISRFGKEKLKLIEKRLKELDVPLKYSQIKDFDFYPVGWRAISLLVVKEVCGLGNEGIKDLCFSEPRFSLVVKLFARYLLTPEKALKKAPEFWREYFTIGDLFLKEFNEKEGRAIFQLKNFKLHPDYCHCLEGYIKGVVKLVVMSDKVECKETKCVFRGDPYHEFLAQWPPKKK